MDHIKGRMQWQELFDESVSKIWEEEPIPILKKTNVSVLRNQLESMQVQIPEHIRSDSPRTSTSKSESQQSFNTMQMEAVNDSGSIIFVSDENVSNVEKTLNSPEIIKKHRKFRRKRKQNDSSTPSESFFRNLMDNTQLDKHSFKENLGGKVDQTSYIFLDHLSPMQPTVSTPPDKISRTSDADCSVIQCTPGSRIEVSKKDTLPSFLLKKRVRKHKKSTLTQMFFVKNEKQDKDNLNFKNDTNHTLVSSNQRSEGESAMGLTDIVSYLNIESSIEKDRNNLDTQDVTDLLASIQYEDFQEDTSLNNAVLEDSDSVTRHVPKNLNEFLAKAQNVPNQAEAAPVVRGKERLKLPGWSCKDCENFYLKQGLSPNQIVALSKCSKHRGQYKPREDTLPGYWDMDVSSEKT